MSRKLLGHTSSDEQDYDGSRAPSRRSDTTPECFKTPEFLKQAKEWDEKLAKKGFKDVEVGMYRRGPKSRWPERTLRVFHSFQWAQERMEGGHGGKMGAAEYYRCASQFLNDGTRNPDGFVKFDHPRDRRVWAYHCEGLTPDQIVSKSIPSSFPRTSKYWVRSVKRDSVCRSIAKSEARMHEWLKINSDRRDESGE